MGTFWWGEAEGGELALECGAYEGVVKGRRLINLLSRDLTKLQT